MLNSEGCALKTSIFVDVTLLLLIGNSTMKHASLLTICGLTLALAITTFSRGDDWPQWRGPDGTGFAPNCYPPTQWSESNNVRWKVEVPGSGHASPIVFGDRVYIITALKTEQTAKAVPEAEPGNENEAEAPPQRRQRGGRGGGARRGGGGGGEPRFGRGRMQARKPSNIYQFMILAYDRSDGQELWRKVLREELPHAGTHQTGTFASNSPITDGEHIFAYFGSHGLYCLDMDGNVKWEKDLGDMTIRMSFGEGASPALYGNTLIVPWDHEGDSFIVALDKTSGQEIWRVVRTEGTTWTTPVIVEVKGKPQVILAGTKATISYDLATGEEVWRCSGLTMNVIPTPVVGHGMIYLMSGFRGSSLQAIKLEEAQGDITGSEAIAWTHNRGTPYTPSPLLSGRNLYFLGSNNGILSCFDAVTGKAHYAGERLDQVRNVYASIVGADGRVYICGRDGNIAVIEDSPTFKTLATNSLDEGINATPAIVGDEIYLRGDQHLYCIGETTE